MRFGCCAGKFRSIFEWFSSLVLLNRVHGEGVFLVAFHSRRHFAKPYITAQAALPFQQKNKAQCWLFQGDTRVNLTTIVVLQGAFGNFNLGQYMLTKLPISQCIMVSAGARNSTFYLAICHSKSTFQAKQQNYPSEFFSINLSPPSNHS